MAPGGTKNLIKVNLWSEKQKSLPQHGGTHREERLEDGAFKARRKPSGGRKENSNRSDASDEVCTEKKREGVAPNGPESKAAKEKKTEGPLGKG